mmetsp:Transcript_115919/g.361076  ORF Transcript_115919/g.361076 Transcript_115919/m.361076 type:complete len:543 (+) Transcript_115919:37-1665(+)
MSVAETRNLILAAQSDQEQSEAPSSAISGERKCTRPLWALVLAVGLLVAVSLALIERRGSVQTAGSLGSHFLQKYDNCEAFFNGDNDCSKQRNYWECTDNDGSWGYVCCCQHGWGDFSNNSRVTTGMISWAAQPARCIDLSTPYAHDLSRPFSSGPAFVQLCTWGNPNKHFHVPRAGTGKIRWATHPKYCLGVKDGQGFDGNLLHLQNCYVTPSAWTTFTVEDVHGGRINGTQIRWAANPQKCLWVSGTVDGALLKLSTCRWGDESELFTVKPPLPPPNEEDAPLLFCLSLMLPFGYEVDVMRAQWIHRAGIFQCMEHSIYSNESITLRNGNETLKTDVMEGSMVVKFGGPWHSALNTDIFIRFWRKVVDDPRAASTQWTAKLDPDAVFFAGRLQQVTRSLWGRGDPKKPVFLNNCHLGMHGPLEVISTQAIDVYRQRWRECVDGEPYSHKQEDFYMRDCWRLLGIKQVDIFNLLFESNWACDERSYTRDGRHPCFSKQVAFHPFKSAAAYMQCWKRGSTMRWSTPVAAMSEVPAKWNHHHG